MLNSQHAIADSSTKSEALKDNEFRVNAPPPGSALLVGNVAVFNVAGNFLRHPG